MQLAQQKAPMLGIREGMDGVGIGTRIGARQGAGGYGGGCGADGYTNGAKVRFAMRFPLGASRG
jgi:hypothetical protein